MTKFTLRFSAAMALALLATSPLTAAKLRLPPPTAPKDRIYSPGTIAKDLEKRGYQIEKMKRKGTTYSITATGPNRNRVQLTVDGRSGDIVGLAVLSPAPTLAAAIAAILLGGKGTRYVDDWHPFGIIIPDIYQTRWTVITTDVWTDYSVMYVTESWSGAGYRFAVPYTTIRPGSNGYSVTTLEVSELSEPVYALYEHDGVEISTEYSEESIEISEATSFVSTHSAELEQMEDSYLGGSVADADVDLAEIDDLDVSDVDDDGDDDGADAADDAADDSAADVDDDADDDPAAEAADVDDDADEAEDPDDADESMDEAEEPDVDEGDDFADEGEESDDAAEDFDDSSDDYDDSGDDGGDDYDDGGDEPDGSAG